MGDGYGFRKIRRELEVTAFGINALVLPPGYETGRSLSRPAGGDVLRPPGRGRDSASATAATHRLGPGGVARVDPGTHRSLRNVGRRRRGPTRGRRRRRIRRPRRAGRRRVRRGRPARGSITRLPGGPILLLHGQPGSARDWDPVIGALGADAHAIAIDRPGWDGQTPPSDLAGNAEVALAALDRACADGATWSGTASARAWRPGWPSLHPDRVRALVLVAPAANLEASGAGRSPAGGTGRRGARGRVGYGIDRAGTGGGAAARG